MSRVMGRESEDEVFRFFFSEEERRRKMKYADIKEVDVANGPGIRVSLFVSGCRHACKGCFNYEAWDFDYGKNYEEETREYILGLLDRPFISGISFLGGEPLEPENQEEVRYLIEAVHARYPEKTVWLYTGFTYEQLQGLMSERPHLKAILDGIDVMVDGKFDSDLKNLRLRFRGSENQRLIDMNRTREQGEVILWDA